MNRRRLLRTTSCVAAAVATCGVLLAATGGVSAAEKSPPASGALAQVDLASATAWTLSIDGGPTRPVKVPGGGWNSDRQTPTIDTMGGVKDHVVYRRQIRVPKLAEGQVSTILFGAVNYGADVFIDGKLVARRVGALTPFEADITDAVTPGRQHTLTVKAYHRRHYYTGKSCDAPVGFDFPAGSKHWCRWAGNTKFAYGITKHVRLAVYPAVAIRDVFVKPSVTRDALQVRLWVHNRSKQDRTLTVTGQLTSWNSDPWRYPAVPEGRLTVPAGKVGHVTLGPFKWGLGPKSYWWPNVPFREDYVAKLHNLTLTLSQGGRLWHRRTQRFGFCQHAEGPYYYTVNGVRVTNVSDGTVESQMSEYDCYSTSPAFGPPTAPRTGCHETWRRYLRIGINTNRICCSIPTETMMRAADEVGFMLMPEGVTWGNGLSRYHEVYTPQTIREMARLCRNHPSVVRYSLTNEVRGPVDKNWPWRGLIDVMMEEDDTRPLVYELNCRGVGRIDGVKRGHAYVNTHYKNIDKGGDIIRGMGEHFWETDGMAAFAVGAQRLRLYDWAYFAPWCWTNYWPNFLQGMSHARHAWKANNGPDRTDCVNGWGSPIVRFVQRSLHPYLLLDHEILRTNPPRARPVGKGTIDWPYALPTCAAGQTVTRKIEMFNGGLSGSTMALKWACRWDRPDGPVAVKGATIDRITVQPGFHVTQSVRFSVPPPGKNSRRLYLVMDSLKDAETVYREDRIYFNVVGTDAQAEEPTTPATPAAAEFVGADDKRQGDWKGAFGGEGYALVGKASKLPAYASITFDGAGEGEARVVGATWRGGGGAAGSVWTWQAKTNDRRALAFATGTGRIAACRYGNPVTFALDVGAARRNVTMYFLDWDQAGVRRQTVTLRSADGTILDKRDLAAFQNGKYLTWRIRGRVLVEIRKIRGKNAVIGGVFFDAAKPEKDVVQRGLILGNTEYGTKPHDCVVGIPPTQSGGFPCAIVIRSTFTRVLNHAPKSSLHSMGPDSGPGGKVYSQ